MYKHKHETRVGLNIDNTYKNEQNTSWTGFNNLEHSANLRNRLPVGGGCVYVLQMFFFVFFCFLLFFSSTKTMRQPFSGTAERIFMKLSPNDRGDVVWNVLPPLGESRAAAWRMANVDALRNVRYDSCGITRGRHRRLRYTTMSGRIDVI